VRGARLNRHRTCHEDCTRRVPDFGIITTINSTARDGAHEERAMGKFDSYSDRVMDLVGQVGDNLRTALPDNAGKWLQTGAALGVAKTGTRAVGGIIRRNPAVVVAAAVGAGLVWYAVHRHRRKQAAQGQVIEGHARRVEARRAAPKPRTTRTRTTTPD